MLPFTLLGLALTILNRTPVAAAQSDSTLVQIEAIKAHFNQSGLVPALLPVSMFNPIALLAVSFNEFGKINTGQLVSREQALYEPDLSLTPINTSVALPSKYTIMMVDAGRPGADQSGGQRRHWLVNGATVPAVPYANLSIAGATRVTRYISPNPLLGNGPHRYVILLFAQPADFLAPADLSEENTGGGIFSVSDYVRVTKLGALVSASYFTCQRGPATITLLPTSAVISQTLPGWKDSILPTAAVVQKANSGQSATRNALAFFLAPIMGFLVL